jgi:hypothetical protein
MRIGRAPTGPTARMMAAQAHNLMWHGGHDSWTEAAFVLKLLAF